MTGTGPRVSGQPTYAKLIGAWGGFTDGTDLYNLCYWERLLAARYREVSWPVMTWWVLMP